MSKALVLTRFPLARDPRPLRMVECLRRDFEVTAMGRGEFAREGVRYLEVPAQAPLGGLTRLRSAANMLLNRQAALAHEPQYAERLAQLGAESFDLVVSHDLLLLPFAFEAAGHGPVLFDAREYHPLHFEQDALWRLTTGRINRHLCATCLPRVQGMFTVSPGIVQKYAREYGVQPVLLPSYSDPVDLEPAVSDADRVRMIYHGSCARNRDIISMVRTLDHLDERFSLDLMMIGQSDPYYQEVAREVATRPRVNLVEPVPVDAIVQTINKYDIGLFVAPPVTFNLQYCLPNKLFEFIQARLMVVVGPSPDMAEVVRTHGVGKVAEGFDPVSVARLLSGLGVEDIMEAKRASHVAASQLSTRQSDEIIRAEVRRLFPG